MIDGKKLYNWIKAQINPYGKPFEGTVFEFGCKVIDYIEAMEKQPKTDWIPCEERLPSENGLYLATFECEDEIVVDIMFMIGKQFYYPEDAIGNFGRSVEIIAWQPLPQPYKKEGAE